MIKLTKDQIKEIAEELDCGMRCYINKETGEIKTVLNFESWQTDDREPWEDVLNDLEENWDKYFEIERMESHESFEVMAGFAESVDSRELRDALIGALNKKHPFQNFKWVVDNSGPYRQKWFDFKNQRLIEWVNGQLENLPIKKVMCVLLMY
jgi:hypothetical protein